MIQPPTVSTKLSSEELSALAARPDGKFIISYFSVYIDIKLWNVDGLASLPLFFFSRTYIYPHNFLLLFPYTH